jgi:hypothetical protein
MKCEKLANSQNFLENSEYSSTSKISLNSKKIKNKLGKLSLT